MKVNLYCDELYPFYGMTSSGVYREVDADVDDATVRRWKRVAKAFRQMQDEMEAAYADGEHVR